MGGLRKIDDTTAEVKRIRVKPELEGKGIGKSILDELIKRGRELGYKKLILSTSENKEKAQGLYKSRGFVEFKRENFHTIVEIYYEKEL